MLRCPPLIVLATIGSLIIAASVNSASAQRLLRGYEFSSPPDSMERLLEGAILVPTGATNRTYNVAILRDDDKLYIYDEQGGCLARLKSDPGLPANEYLFGPVQNDECGLGPTGDWLIRYFRLAVLPCEADSCTQRRLTLRARRNWPGTLDATATMAVLVGGALDPTDRKASAAENIRQSADPNEIILSPYALLYAGEVTDNRGQSFAMRVYEITLGSARKPSLFLYEPASGCLTPMSRPTGYRYFEPLWSSATRPFEPVVDTQCDPQRRLNSWESLEAMPLENRQLTMNTFVGPILWAEREDGRYDVSIQKYSKYSSDAWDESNMLAVGTLAAVTERSMFPPPAEPPKKLERFPLKDYPPSPGFVYKSLDYWRGYQDGGVLARVFNGDFEELTSSAAFHGYLVAYVEMFYQNCERYLPGARKSRRVKRWDEDQFGRVDNYRESYVEFDPDFDGLYQQSESFSEFARALKMMGAIFDGVMIGGQRGVDTIRYGIEDSAVDVFSREDEMAAFLIAARCNSATRRQLEQNFIRAAAGRPSLQASGEPLAGAAAESDKPGGAAVLPVKPAPPAANSEPVAGSAKASAAAKAEAPAAQGQAGAAVELSAAAPVAPPQVTPAPPPASPPPVAPAPSAADIRPQEAEARQAKFQEMQALSDAFGEEQQALMRSFQTRMQSATTSAERTAIQKEFREETKRSQVELQRKLDEINAR